MTRRLSSIIDEAYVDVKQAVQFTRLVCDFVSGIKKKAEAATVLGVSTFADEYFLLPELYNLDARPIKDAAENLIANEKSFMLLIGEATNKNEYARHWLAPVDYVSGDSVPSGYLQTYNRHLILNESNPGLSGIFRTISPGGRTQDAALPEQLEFCSVYVASGDKYGGKCLSQVLKINKVGVSPQLWITERYAQAPNIGAAGDPPPPGILSGITTASAEYYSSINSYKTGADDALVAAELFLAAVNALKQTTSLATTISSCDAVLALEIPTVETFLTAQTGIATIETIDSEFDLENMMVSALNDLQYDKTDYPNGERIISSLIEYYFTRKPAETSSRRKAFQIVEQFEAGKLVEKKDNPNSTRPSGTPAATLTSGVPAGDAFDKIAQALFDMNAMNEYWAQVGWASAEKATKNNPHVRQLEQVLKDKDLEELITAHDKAVDSMLNIELNITPPDRVDLDMSPSPFDL